LMLSLLSLFLASGPVLRDDTQHWSPNTYPNPQINYTLCNTWPASTLCDPDHILTDHWRMIINKNIQEQIEKLRNSSDLLYNDNASGRCHRNATNGITIYVILANRIITTSNNSIDTDLINFGNGVADKYGLNSQSCKNFIVIVGVEEAKLAYVRTGYDLKLPNDLMKIIFKEYSELFNAKNYMEGLNKIITEIGERMNDLSLQVFFSKFSYLLSAIDLENRKYNVFY
uniref:Envelope glycoprotein L n=1 Tax=Dracunculus medinensis TaxID=318479 RepID=A0A0N4UNK9_DRAME